MLMTRLAKTAPSARCLDSYYQNSAHNPLITCLSVVFGNKLKFLIHSHHYHHHHSHGYHCYCHFHLDDQEQLPASSHLILSCCAYLRWHARSSCCVTDTSIPLIFIFHAFRWSIRSIRSSCIFISISAPLCAMSNSILNLRSNSFSLARWESLSLLLFFLIKLYSSAVAFSFPTMCAWYVVGILDLSQMCINSSHVAFALSACFKVLRWWKKFHRTSPYVDSTLSGRRTSG